MSFNWYDAMISVQDSRGKWLQLTSPPQRVISLVPSTTETLFDLGCEKHLVGVTRFCVHPMTKCKQLTKVGGTKKIDIEKVKALKPDLVFCNKEENTQEICNQLEMNDISTFVAFPKDIDDAVTDISTMGKIMGQDKLAQKYISKIRTQRKRIQSSNFRYCYLIWYKPWMAVNADCFISSMLAEFGGKNVFSGHQSRYFDFTLAQIPSDIDYIFLSSEPFPFKTKHQQEIHRQTNIPSEKIIFVDGEMCSWHGTRIALAVEYLTAKLNRHTVGE